MKSKREQTILMDDVTATHPKRTLPVKNWCPETLLTTLLGKWHFEREIPKYAFMKGKALFKVNNQDDVFYREDGILTLDDYQTNFFNEYTFKKEPGGFSVYFQGGENNLFHTVILTLNEQNIWYGNAEHQCLCDHYETQYAFLPNAQFTIAHKVQGPRKNYRINTRYSWDHS